MGANERSRHWAKGNEDGRYWREEGSPVRPFLRQGSDGEEGKKESTSPPPPRRKGPPLPNTKRKNPGAKEFREARANHDGVSPLTVELRDEDGTLTGTKTFYLPFAKVDLETDYARAWGIFQCRSGG